jgi:hypothetical protein
MMLQIPPKLKLHNPNCPPEEWWQMAANHPLEAMRSDLFSLMLLEDPARWEEMERNNLLT